MSDLIIETKNLTKQYGTQKSVANLNIHVKKGRIYGLLGRNGAGKTTTMKMLLGLTQPTSGEVNIFNKNIWGNDKKILPRIGNLIEAPGFYPNLTGTENLKLFARLRGVSKRNAVSGALEVVGLPYGDKKLFSQYSLGMKQRLAIALAIMHDPELLILDEPINRLDPIGIAEVRSFIRELCDARGKTSHILSEISLLADDIGIIDHGVFLEEEKERQEAEEKARELIEGKRNPQADVPFMDYLQKWLLQSKPTISKTTFKGYRTMLDGRVNRYFTKLDVTVGEVTPQHLQDFYQTIFDEGHTPNTVIHYHAVLRKASQNAVKKDILGSNPADRVDRPKKNVYQAQFYSAEEIMTLFDAGSNDPLEICVKLAAYYGLRRSEVLGLKWDAINLEQKTISIRHKVIEDEVDGKFIPVGEDVLKTKSSFRTLPLLPSVEKLLLAEKEKQEMYRRLFKRSYCRDYLDYICLDQTGKLMRPNYVTEHFSWLLEKFGLKKIRFHDLRHSCASLLLANGISMKQIRIWLGHSTFSTTADIYSHLGLSCTD